MLNLSISAPGTSEVGSSELAAVAVDSPRTGPGSAQGSGSGEAAAPGSFSAFLARAMSTPEMRALASADGKALPVSELQTQLLGEETRLVMSADGEAPGDDSLYAFALQQGMDPATVAAVLWPGMAVPPGLGAGAGLSPGSGAGPGSGQGAGGGAAELGAIGQNLLAAGIDGLGLSGEAAAGGVNGAAASGIAGAAAVFALTPAGAADALGAAANALGLKLGEPLSATALASPASLTAEMLMARGRDAAGMSTVGMSAVDGQSTPGLGVAGGLVSAASGAGVGTLASAIAGALGSAGAPGADKLGSDSALSPTVGAATLSGAGAQAAAAAATPRVDLAPSQNGPVASGLPGAMTMPSASQILSGMGRARAASGEPGVSWSTSASAGVPLIGATLGNSAQTAIAPGVGGVLSVGGVSALQAGGPVNPVFARQAFAALASEPNAGLDALEPVSEPGHFEGMLSEQMTQAMSEGAETSGHGHHSGGHRTASSLVEPLSVGGDESAQGASGDADERQAMTQRLAEGLAQRISAQIAQNNWKLQVELRPAHLGQVNIELAMNGGQLEARFDATQVGARAMIQEGLDRLRQDLERSGMNVAYLGMQAGGGSSGGGKPTLRSRSGETAQAGQTEAIREPALSERSSRVGRDGLDVMV